MIRFLNDPTVITGTPGSVFPTYSIYILLLLAFQQYQKKFGLSHIQTKHHENAIPIFLPSVRNDGMEPTQPLRAVRLAICCITVLPTLLLLLPYFVKRKDVVSTICIKRYSRRLYTSRVVSLYLVSTGTLSFSSTSCI